MALKYHKRKRINYLEGFEIAFVVVVVLTFILQVGLTITDALGWTK